MSDVLTTGDRLETLQQDLAEVAQLRPEVAELMETACRIVATALRIVRPESGTNTLNELGKTFRALRHKQGLTLQNLSTRSGVSLGYTPSLSFSQFSLHIRCSPFSSRRRMKATEACFGEFADCPDFVGLLSETSIHQSN